MFSAQVKVRKISVTLAGKQQNCRARAGLKSMWSKLLEGHRIPLLAIGSPKFQPESTL